MPNRDWTYPSRTFAACLRRPAMALRDWPIAALVGVVLTSQVAAAGPTFVVNSLADVPAGANTTDAICETATGNGVCTLRAAIMEANGTRDAIVRVPAGFYAFTRVSTPGIHPENGDLDVRSPMKIEGDGPSVSIIDANALSRGFRVELAQATDKVEMRGLTIQNGVAPAPEAGGGIVSLSRLLLENVNLTGNTAYDGGGVFAFAHLTMMHGVVEGNRATDAYAGGVGFLYSTTSLIQDSRIENNLAEYRGGGSFCLHEASW